MNKELKQLYLSEIKFLRLGIKTCENMISMYERYFDDNPKKYTRKILETYKRINGFNKLIGDIRYKLIKEGFNK